MAAYPSLPIQTRVRVIRDTITEGFADDGTLRAADLGGKVLYGLDITHPLLSSSERDTLDTFWAANKNTVVAVSAGDGHDYDCLLIGEPDSQVVSASRWTVRVSLRGNRVA